MEGDQASAAGVCKLTSLEEVMEVWWGTGGRLKVHWRLLCEEPTYSCLASGLELHERAGLGRERCKELRGVWLLQRQ